MEEISLDQCEIVSGGRAGALGGIIEIAVKLTELLIAVGSDNHDLGSNTSSWNAP